MGMRIAQSHGSIFRLFSSFCWSLYGYRTFSILHPLTEVRDEDWAEQPLAAKWSGHRFAELINVLNFSFL